MDLLVTWPKGECIFLIPVVDGAPVELACEEQKGRAHRQVDGVCGDPSVRSKLFYFGSYEPTWSPGDRARTNFSQPATSARRMQGADITSLP
ncbi:MAG TPA: hypothetical protein VKB88_31475 [Bryobacteraceae bacterium]|nr:hypothetical protein [Bryobacteraceae bacterium]